eukprot:SM000115S23901  [mRNA]  locus=s115:159824:168761:+ [translate_table: standard]
MAGRRACAAALKAAAAPRLSTLAPGARQPGRSPVAVALQWSDGVPPAALPRGARAINADIRRGCSRRTPGSAPSRADSRGASLQQLTEIGMPSLSPTMTQGNIVSWKKKEGEAVAAGDVLCEIETDKATLEMESMEEGFLAKILLPDNSKDIPVGQAIAVMVDSEDDISKFADYSPGAAPPPPKKEENEDDSSDAPPPSPPPPQKESPKPSPTEEKKPEAPKAQAPPPPTPSGGEGRVFASPAARKLAEEKGVDISQIKGTGPDNRIVKADIEDYLGPAPAKQDTVPTAQPGAQTPISGQEYDDIPNSQIRKITARRLLQSKQTIPHYYLTVDLKVDKLVALRKELNALQEKAGGKKLSVNDFIIKAAAMALKKVPQVNSSWNDDYNRQYKNIDISVAVQTEHGLMVPFVKNADTLGVASISEEVKRLADAARQNKLKPSEFQGGTFTISNLGMYGIKSFSAIINPPQACILAVGTTEKRVVPGALEGEYTSAEYMSATLSCDHRLVQWVPNGLEPLRAMWRSHTPSFSKVLTDNPKEEHWLPTRPRREHDAAEQFLKPSAAPSDLWLQEKVGAVRATTLRGCSAALPAAASCRGVAAVASCAGAGGGGGGVVGWWPRPRKLLAVLASRQHSSSGSATLDQQLQGSGLIMMHAAAAHSPSRLACCSNCVIRRTSTFWGSVAALRWHIPQAPARRFWLGSAIRMGRRAAKIATRKGAQDARKAKLYGRIGKQIVAAVRAGGASPGSNAALERVLQQAKLFAVPRDVIDRNLKRASEKGQAAFEEVTYEVYGYGGVGLVLEVLTDNMNRAAANIREVVRKGGGKMADMGSVMFNFRKCGVVAVPFDKVSSDEILLAAMDAGAEDVMDPRAVNEEEPKENPSYKVITPQEDFFKCRLKLEQAGIPIDVDGSGLQFMPTALVQVDDDARELNEVLRERLLELEDVDAVYLNQD